MERIQRCAAASNVRRAVDARRRWPAGRPSRGGWSMLELVITIFVIVDILALLLPWLDSLREPARATGCEYNLQLLGKAAIQHAALHQFYPSGGWGTRFVGDPDRGFGTKQPGGWMYSILPYIDEKDLWSLGKGVDLTISTKVKGLAFVAQITKPIGLFYCSSRRAATLYPHGSQKPPLAVALRDLAAGVVKSDYAINTGDQPLNEFGSGPPSYVKGDDPKYKWHDTSMMNGVSFLRSEVKPEDVTDGLGMTYMLGEKYLNPDQYSCGCDNGDNESAMNGFDNDTNRCGGEGPFNQPRQDEAGVRDKVIWGSAHPSGFHMVFCDGAVRTVNYDIDQELHNRLSNRSDGSTIEAESWQKSISGQMPQQPAK